MNKGKIQVGIAGLGRSGWDIHAKLLEPLKTKYKIVAAFDPNAQRRQEAEERFDCKTYTRYADLLKDDNVEVLVVASPSHLHGKHTMQAFKAGKHVVCEKPMARTLNEADKMIACAKKYKRVLSIFQNRRYHKDFVKVRKVIESGVLGRIVHARIAYHKFSRRWDWQTLKKYAGGTLNNTAPHALDQALNLFGDGQPNVFCLRDKALTLGDTDDHVKVILHKKNHPTIEVEITAASAYGQDMWLVMGTQGGLTGTGKELKWKYFNPKRIPKRVLTEEPTQDRSYNSDQLPCVEKTWSEKDDKGPGEKAFYLDLYSTIRKGTPLGVKPEEVRRQMWVLDQCRKQAPV